MHLNRVTIRHDLFPVRDQYPFNLGVLQGSDGLEFKTPVTLLVGENGTGKSTFLEALCRKCGIHIWEGMERTRFKYNPYEKMLSRCLEVEWADGRVPGSFFASQIFRNFAQLVDEWAALTPDTLDYYGGRSLVTQSHGQSLMSYFKARYKVRGIYFLDEPETALSPRTQLELLRMLREMAAGGHAQFVIASHSPILLSCPGATLYSFDAAPIRPVAYEDTEHCRVYREFMASHPGKKASG